MSTTTWPTMSSELQLSVMIETILDFQILVIEEINVNLPRPDYRKYFPSFSHHIRAPHLEYVFFDRHEILNLPSPMYELACEQKSLQMNEFCYLYDVDSARPSQTKNEAFWRRPYRSSSHAEMRHPPS